MTTKSILYFIAIAMVLVIVALIGIFTTTPETTPRLVAVIGLFVGWFMLGTFLCILGSEYKIKEVDKEGKKI
jgi:hypothetical protein